MTKNRVLGEIRSKKHTICLSHIYTFRVLAVVPGFFLLIFVGLFFVFVHASLLGDCLVFGLEGLGGLAWLSFLFFVSF